MKNLRYAILAFLLAILPLASTAQPRCNTSRLNEAMLAYELGLFTSTLDLLNPCLPDDFADKPQKVSAYELIALTYIATDSLEYARTWIKELLNVDPHYRPDPQIAPPLLVDYVQDLKPRWYTWLWKGNAWYHWVGRGVLVGSVVSAPLLLRKNPAPDLPGAPGFPPP